MKPGTLVRLAVAGTRTDTARVVLTALSAALATLAGLAALTVLAIPEVPGHRWAEAEQYTNDLLREPGLRGGTAFALLLLTIPVLALAGQSARLGAPARDRRLAAIRLAGATPRQVTVIAVLETGVAALLGTLAGLAVHLVGRELLHRPDATGRLALPTDVLPAPGAVAAVVLGLPVVAAAATALLLRKVTTTPFGVVRRAPRKRAPRPWPGLLIGVGLAAALALLPILRGYDRSGTEPPRWLLIVLGAGGPLAAVLGVVLGSGWLSYRSGRLLHRYGRGPAALLAARRLMADPWAGSRTLAALLAAVIFGAGAAAMRAWFVLSDRVQREANRQAGYDEGADPFYLRTVDLVDLAVGVAVAIAAAGLLVALVEGIVARRRTYAALVATGVPQGTLRRSIAWQALAPAVPAILVALAVGLLLGRTYAGKVQTGTSGGGLTPDVPLAELALLGVGALAAVLVTVGVGLLFLRASATPEELRTT